MTAKEGKGGGRKGEGGCNGKGNVSVMIIKVYDSNSRACKANVNVLFRSELRTRSVCGATREEATLTGTRSRRSKTKQMMKKKSVRPVASAKSAFMLH